MIWPPYLLDLNLIENLWLILKIIIRHDHSELNNALDND